MSQAASHGMPGDPVNGRPVSATIAEAQPLDMSDVYAPIKSELAQVEATLKRELSSETPFVDSLLEHSWMLGGKRIRPVLLLLAGKCAGNLKSGHFDLAAAVEMIHIATLVHDDVLDKATHRRHQETVNSKWGEKVSILLGDYLFTHAFHVASKAGCAESLNLLAKASNRVCEGEMRQNAWQGNYALKEADYLQMISEKTAELCSISCLLGAKFAGAPTSNAEEFETFGRYLGVAFQIIDDVLDLVGKQEKVGKTLGTDLVNQKPTLPLIHCLENSSDSQKKQLMSLLEDPNSNHKQLLCLLDDTDSIEYARAAARENAELAARFTDSLADSEAADALRMLSQFVLSRTF
ncbi:MAG: polyprenyl synthetase family protein [Planctomycetota bacterium]